MLKLTNNGPTLFVGNCTTQSIPIGNAPSTFRLAELPPIRPIRAPGGASGSTTRSAGKARPVKPLGPQAANTSGIAHQFPVAAIRKWVGPRITSVTQCHGERNAPEEMGKTAASGDQLRMGTGWHPPSLAREESADAERLTCHEQCTHLVRGCVKRCHAVNIGASRTDDFAHRYRPTLTLYQCGTHATGQLLQLLPGNRGLDCNQCRRRMGEDDHAAHRQQQAIKSGKKARYVTSRIRDHYENQCHSGRACNSES